MAKIYKNIEELIGKTPLLELTHLEEIHNLDARVLAKVEFLNPGGSAKDRVAKKMVEDAEAKGILKAALPSLNLPAVILALVWQLWQRQEVIELSSLCLTA